MYVFVLSSSINGLCHHVGYKNFDNTATNIRTLALLTGGEGLHNNHHGYPRSPKFSFKAERDRSRVADHQAADRAEAREAVQDDRRNRRVGERRLQLTRAIARLASVRRGRDRPAAAPDAGAVRRLRRRRRLRRPSSCAGSADSEAGAAVRRLRPRRESPSSARPAPASRRGFPSTSAPRGKCRAGRARAARAGSRSCRADAAAWR